VRDELLLEEGAPSETHQFGHENSRFVRARRP
jgi:hypothetical protein